MTNLTFHNMTVTVHTEVGAFCGENLVTHDNLHTQGGVITDTNEVGAMFVVSSNARATYRKLQQFNTVTGTS